MIRQHRHTFVHRRPFEMHRGGMLAEFELAWESWGHLNADRSNAVLVCTGLSPDAHAAAHAEDEREGWWEFMIGPGKPIDTNRWYVICVNSLGSCKGSTGPASIDPASGAPYATDFPELAIEDISASIALLLESLAIEQLEAVVGPSMGGMTALSLLLRHPGIARRLVHISSAPAATPFAIAIRSLQREIIRADRNYANGRYHGERGPETGMRLARKLGMVSYRSAVEWLGRFGRETIPDAPTEPFGAEFQIESYLATHAERFISSFDPNCYLYLSRAMDWFNATEGHESTEAALADALGVESALVIGVESDILFPMHQQKEIARALANGNCRVDLRCLASIQGHDAFLVDRQRFAPPVADFFADT